MKSFLTLSLLMAVICCTACKHKDDPAPVKEVVPFFFAGSSRSTSPLYADFSNARGIAVYLNEVVVSDIATGSIKKIDAFDRTITTFATGFSKPTGLLADGVGNLYVADAERHVIYRVTSDGNYTVFAGSGVAGFGDGTGTNAYFNGPTNLAMDTHGDILVTDYNNSAIRKITMEGVVTTVMSASSQMADGIQEGEEILNAPYGIVSGGGMTYVTDGNRVLIVTWPTKAVKAYNGPGPFSQAAAITMDPYGNLLVSDVNDWKIYKIYKNGEVTVFFSDTGKPGTSSYPSEDKILKACYGMVMSFDLIVIAGTGDIVEFGQFYH